MSDFTARLTGAFNAANQAVMELMQARNVAADTGTGDKLVQLQDELLETAHKIYVLRERHTRIEIEARGGDRRE